MGFFIEDNLFLTDTELKEKRKKIMYQKIRLLQQFRNYVREYLRISGETLDIEYDLINGDSNVRFKDLKKGENFTYERIYFKFNLRTELITDYSKNHYELTKLYATEGDEIIEDVAEGSNLSNIKPRTIWRPKANLSIISDFEREKIEEIKNKKVDRILDKVFKGLLTFKDDKFKKLVQINAYLEGELREIDSMLEPKDNDNSLGHKNKN